MTSNASPSATGTYPREVMAGGQAITLRPMQPDDRERMLAFARALPDHDLLFLPQDITSEEEVDAWIGEVEGGLTPTVVALLGAEIVGYSALAQSAIRWTRHVGELRVMVAQRFRGKGLGRILTTEAFRIGVDLGVEKMLAHMTIDQEGAVKMFRRLGFQSEALLRDHVKDAHGRTYDMLVLSHHTAVFLSTLGLERDESGYRRAVPPISFPPGAAD